MRKLVRTAVAAWVVAMLLLTTGCGGADVHTQTTTTTMGQELMDLKKAYDTGVISEQEYDRKREEILDRN